MVPRWFRWPCDNLPHLEERANRAVERRSSFEGIPNGFARMSFLDGVGSSHTKATATEIQNLRRICCAHGPASFGQVNSSLNVDPLEDWSETELPSCVRWHRELLGGQGKITVRAGLRGLPALSSVSPRVDEDLLSYVPFSFMCPLWVFWDDHLRFFKEI